MSGALQNVLADAARHNQGDPRFTLYAHCASGALGHHRRVCSGCGQMDWLPNACRSAGCPFCRSRERMQWATARESDLPAVPYFHVVFTVPRELRPIARAHPRTFYRCLFTASRLGLLDICSDERHLGVTPLAFAVLHTWTRRLHLHPHVHVVVSAGGLRPDGSWRWAGDTRKKAFLVPLAVVRRHFQTVLINQLLDAFDRGALPELPFAIAQRHALRHYLLNLRRKQWTVHMKRPLCGAQALVRYLARYVNRVGISPQRVLSYDGEMVRVSWQDRRAGNQERIDTHSARAFLALLKQHLPPRRLVRVRYWGLLAHRVRQSALGLVRAALAKRPPVPASLAEALAAIMNNRERQTADADLLPGPRCRHCGGTLLYDSMHLRVRELMSRSQIPPLE